MIGFRDRNPVTGALTMSSDDLGLLFLDQFSLSAGETATRTYARVAGSEVRVVAMGSTNISGAPGATITTSGDSVNVSITALRAGWFFLTRE